MGFDSWRMGTIIFCIAVSLACSAVALQKDQKKESKDNQKEE